MPEIDVVAFLPAQVNAAYPDALLTTSNVGIASLQEMMEGDARRPNFFVGAYSDGAAVPMVFLSGEVDDAFVDQAGVVVPAGVDPNGLRRPRVSIIVRSDPVNAPSTAVDSYTRALKTAAAIASSLNGRAPTGYLWSTLVSGGPALLTQDAKGRFLFTIATELWVAT
jgi:hypothetical protein